MVPIGKHDIHMCKHYKIFVNNRLDYRLIFNHNYRMVLVEALITLDKLHKIVIAKKKM